ncbi:MAG: hypothetical protein HQK54_09150 [Oligoflexales bacterium]|nr:hypothetical protein [Oligoflexales bacterium]
MKIKITISAIIVLSALVLFYFFYSTPKKEKPYTRIWPEEVFNGIVQTCLMTLKSFNSDVKFDVSFEQYCDCLVKKAESSGIISLDNLKKNPADSDYKALFSTFLTGEIGEKAKNDCAFP